MNIRCSALPTLFLCPAKENEERGLPERKNEDATEGTILHEVCAGHEHELTPEQRRTVDWALTLRDRLVSQYFTEGFQVEKEIEMSEVLFENTLTGHADFVAYNESIALITDYKFGRIEVETAELNHQLRGYAILVQARYGVSEVIVAVIQPRIESLKQVTVCRYSNEDIESALEELEVLFVEVSHKNAPHAPSEEACRYCRAKENWTCPAIKSELVKAESSLQTMPAVELATNDELEKWMDKLPLLEKCLKSIKDEFKSRAEKSPELFPNWFFKEGSKNRDIVNPLQVFGLLPELTQEEFVSTCSISAPKLEELLIAKNGVLKKNGAEYLKSRLGACLVEDRNAPSLKRKS